MQPPRRRADHFGQPRLDMHVNVLEAASLRHAGVGIFGGDLVQPFDDRLGVGFERYALPRSIAACACGAAISSRHILLSKPIEAFISRITASGPLPKRPPQVR